MKAGVAKGIPFGVPPVDRHIGAIPPGGTVLLRSDPTVEALPFLMQAAAQHLRDGREVVFVVTARPPSRIAQAIEELEGPIDRRRLLAVDAHSAMMGTSEGAPYHVATPSELMSIVAAIDRAGREHRDAVLLVDSLNVWLDRTDAGRFLSAVPRLLDAAKRFRLTAALFTAWGYPREIEDALSAFDAVVALRGVEERVVLHQTVAVERTPWGQPALPTLFKVGKPGGIVAYIPKIVVIGPHNAGKTTFVHTVSDTALSVERMGTTVAMDRGTVTLSGVKAEVFGTPGQERFDPLLPTLAGQAVGAILVLDATQPDTFPRGKQMLEKIWKRGLRVIIALNKSDQDGALGVAEATLRLAPPDGVEVVACIASDAKSARAVLQRMIDKVLSSGAA